ncbi:methionine--tRNA ligase [Chitinophagales bacterium]|nr:methionine--tRNA ligase [Chitinophagales bacterium]
METAKRFTITSALPYTNGPVHIGQLAGAYVPADIYVRYLRKKHGKENVVFICGSDEHGVPITLSARKEGVSPQEIVDKYHKIIKDSFVEFGIDFDIYHRTSAPIHHETAADFFSKLHADGVFIEKETEQYYDPEAKLFLADRYISGTCPKCSNPNAYGDQCEKCGTSLSPLELINPKSTISGSEPIRKKTKHWYLPLDKMQEDWLAEWIVDGKGRTENWKKHVMGQCKSWLDTGLRPRAVTRDLNWGVQVPVKDAEGKVLYVWFDAPIGYISATKQWALDNNRDWEPFWKDEETKLVHFMGKDNIVFHCIIFPAMLKAEGSYILPTNVPANQFMNMEGDKMSTSRNWTVWLHEYLAQFPGKQDILRYCLTMNMPETKDSEFTWKDFQARCNNELVANLGNFINRVFVLTKKYFDGKVQAVGEQEIDRELLQHIPSSYAAIEKRIENYEFKLALAELMALSDKGNQYLARTEPWKVVKEDPKRCGEILSTSIQLIAQLAELMDVFLPASSAKLREMMKIEALSSWSPESLVTVPDGHQLGNSSLLFEKIPDELVEAEMAKLQAIKDEREKAAEPESKLSPLKTTIEYDDFVKLDMRVGTILTAEKMPKADRLLILKVDLGFEERTIVSGLAEHFNTEDIVGQQVTVVANLAPRKLRGVVSEGMVLTAEQPDGSLKLLAPAKAAENGSVIA